MFSVDQTPQSEAPEPVQQQINKRVEVNMDNYEDLRRICAVIGVAYQPVNHEIDVKEQVRVLDEQQKRFLGLYTLEQAISKAKSMGKEVVLMNMKVSPPLCKIADYRKNLYEQFIKEVIMAPTEEEKAKRRVRAKVVTLRPKMTMNDLKNKIRQAQEMADKYESVRVQISFLPADEDKARNLFDTFCTEARKALDVVNQAGEAPVDKKKKADEDHDESDDEEIDPSQSQMLRAEFKKRGSTGVFNFGNNVSLTLEKMRQLIDDYFEKKEKDVKKPFVSKMASRLESTGGSSMQEQAKAEAKTTFRSEKEFHNELKRQSRPDLDTGQPSKSKFKKMLKQRDYQIVKYQPEQDQSRTVEADLTQSTLEDRKNLQHINELMAKRHQKRAATYDLLRKLGVI